MFCLVYCSVARKDLKPGDLTKMLEKARRYNKTQGITGCLLYYKGNFIQYLEGNQVKVLSLFDKITKDKRHHKVQMIAHSERDSREFENWEMAFEDFYGDNDQITYLKLLVSSFFDDPEQPSQLHPASIPFWETVNKLLNTNSRPKIG